MDINYIKEFVVLANTENYLQASDMLYISQSSLSKHIASLEKELGEPLFDRTTRKVILNDAGRAFLPYAMEISKAQSAYRKLFEDRKKLRNNTINIGISYRIFELMVAFRKENKKYQLNIIESNKAGDIQELIHNDKCDIGFIVDSDQPDPLIETIPYIQDDYVAILPSNHALSSNMSVQLEDLRNEEFILLPEESAITSNIKHLCLEAGFEPNIAFTGFRGNNVIDFVKQEMGVSILPKKSVEHLITSEIKLVNIVPSIHSKIMICYKKGRKLSAGAQSFIDFALSFVNSEKFK